MGKGGLSWVVSGAVFAEVGMGSGIKGRGWFDGRV